MSRHAMRAASLNLPPRLRRNPLRSHLLHRRPHHAGMPRKMMSSSTADSNPSAAVITVSDSCSRGEREDRSGPAVIQLLESLKVPVTIHEVVPDDKIEIQN